MRTALPLAVLLALAELLHQLHAKNYEIEFDHAEGTYNAEYFGPNSTMWVEQQTKTAHSTLTSRMDILKPLPNDSMLEIFLLEKYEKRYIQSFIKYRNKFCDYVRYEKSPLHSRFKTYFKMPPSCPMQGFFSIENWRFDDDILPPIMPGPDNWKLNIIISSGTGTGLLKCVTAYHVDRSKVNRGRG